MEKKEERLRLIIVTVSTLDIKIKVFKKKGSERYPSLSEKILSKIGTGNEKGLTRTVANRDRKRRHNHN